VAKNALKTGIWAWLALLFFIFSCESEAEREKELAREASIQRQRKYDSLQKDPFILP